MGALPRDSQFLDLLYGAAIEPQLWVPVMERLADAIGGHSAMLSRFNMRDGSGAVEIARIDPAEPERYFAHYAQRNPLSNVADPDGYLRGWEPRILTDEDWIPKEALLASEYYNDFMAPQDMHSVVMIRLGRIGDDVVAVSITRPRRHGPFEAADLALARRLHPDLIRAFELGRKLDPVLALGRDMTEVVDASPLGILLLDRDGRVRHANRAGQRLLCGQGLAVVGGRLTAPGRTAERLRSLIAQAAGTGGAQPAGGSMSLEAPDRSVPLSVTVAPLRSERVSLMADGGGVIVCVADPASGVRPPAERLRELFGLTAAEAKVAMALFEGAAPRQISESLEISFHTVRVHMARIYDKTGVSRQAGLIGLISRSAGLELL